MVCIANVAARQQGTPHVGDSKQSQHNATSNVDARSNVHLVLDQRYTHRTMVCAPTNSSDNSQSRRTASCHHHMHPQKFSTSTMELPMTELLYHVHLVVSVV